MALMPKLWHGVYGKNCPKPMAFAARGLILAAPASGSGKTIVTLGLMRCLARQGMEVTPIKVGPDYIDPVFHEMASGRPCRSLDTWAMRASTVTQGVVDASAAAGSVVICEGVMGLFDGARGVDPKRDGSTASLARETGWSVILVVDAAAQAASAAAVVRGFSSHDLTVPIKGVLFNRVGSASHDTILREAMAEALPEIPVLGCLPHVSRLNLPSRHLGLVQAIEQRDFSKLLECAADWIEKYLDLEMLMTLASKRDTAPVRSEIDTLPVIGGRIAVAKDEAFSFIYPHVLESWQRAGACIDFFSPLADQGPNSEADVVYLPGGYPELHAGRLAENSVFHTLMSSARERGAAIFGECGGYMVLGEELTSEDGSIHSMLGFLPLRTSFAKRKLNLGYRIVRMLTNSLLGEAGMVFRGHEFHYATIAREMGGQPLFQASNAAGEDMGKIGLVAGRVAGSFVHLIDQSS